MRLLLALAAYAALTAATFAQPPTEITATERIDLRIGQTRTFEFDKPYTSLVLSSETVAKLNVQTDRTFTIMGTGPGETLLTVNFHDNDVHRMGIIVGGRTVRIFGVDKDVKDYVGFFCTSTDCGRADSEIPAPTSMSIEKRGRDKNGNMVTTTKNYGP